MIGNTLEWCRDKYKANLGTNEVVNPIGTVGNERVLRGSRFNYSWTPYARTTYRSSDITYRSSDQAKAYGFRVVCPIGLKYNEN